MGIGFFYSKSLEIQMDLKAAKFNFSLQLADDIYLPNYKGSLFRDGFGVAFKKLVCIQPGKNCSECLLNTSCVHAYVFETRVVVVNSMISLNRTAPHPFIIEPVGGKNSTRP
ncbi:hypothetical protein BVY01_00940 [bacterium I07]|nr:hypothetical protein BVY01_00940 [bacterium I07]